MTTNNLQITKMGDITVIGLKVFVPTFYSKNIFDRKEYFITFNFKNMSKDEIFKNGHGLDIGKYMSKDVLHAEFICDRITMHEFRDKIFKPYLSYLFEKTEFLKKLKENFAKFANDKFERDPFFDQIFFGFGGYYFNNERINSKLLNDIYKIIILRYIVSNINNMIDKYILSELVRFIIYDGDKCKCPSDNIYNFIEEYANYSLNVFIQYFNSVKKIITNEHFNNIYFKLNSLINELKNNELKGQAYEDNVDGKFELFDQII